LPHTQMIAFKLTRGTAYYVGRNISTEMHTHHALEFIFGIAKPFDLITAGKDFTGIFAAVIAPNQPHRFTGGNAPYLFIFLEPELPETGQIMKHFDLGKKKATVLTKLTCLPEAEKVFDFSFFVNDLSIKVARGSANPLDERIKSVLVLIKNNLAHQQFNSEALAAGVFLSTSRFLHLFKEQIGLPLRKYILWCRVLHAAEHLLQGNNLTACAHAAGFSDSAHFSRTFSVLFGVSPSSVLKK